MTIEFVDPPKDNQTEHSETPTQEPKPPQPPITIHVYDGPERGKIPHDEIDGGE